MLAAPTASGNRFLKRWLLCGDGFVVWNGIGHVEVVEVRNGSDAVVNVQIADVTPDTGESGYPWAQLSGNTLYLGDRVTFWQQAAPKRR